MIGAARTENYAAYVEAMGRLTKSCNECHATFKP